MASWCDQTAGGERVRGQKRIKYGNFKIHYLVGNKHKTQQANWLRHFIKCVKIFFILAAHQFLDFTNVLHCSRLLMVSGTGHDLGTFQNFLEFYTVTVHFWKIYQICFVICSQRTPSYTKQSECRAIFVKHPDLKLTENGKIVRTYTLLEGRRYTY